MKAIEKAQQRFRYLRSHRGSFSLGLILGASAVLISAFLLSLERNILRLPTEADRSADAVLVQHARLQVGASQCRAINPAYMDLYNSYIRRHGGELQQASERLTQLRNRQSGHPASVHFYLAELMNRASLEARADYASFCGDSFKVLQVIMSQVETGGLTEFTVNGAGRENTRVAARGQ